MLKSCVNNLTQRRRGAEKSKEEKAFSFICWCAAAHVVTSVNSHELHELHEFVFIRVIRDVIFSRLLLSLMLFSILHCKI